MTFLIWGDTCKVRIDSYWVRVRGLGLALGNTYGLRVENQHDFFIWGDTCGVRVESRRYMLGQGSRLTLGDTCGLRFPFKHSWDFYLYTLIMLSKELFLKF